jgi:GDP-mannose 4,6-dehydratase
LTRCLISGVSGFVGSHLAEHLIANTDWDIYGLIRWRSPLDNLETLIPRINAKDRVHLLYGDLRDAISIQKAVRDAQPDYVFHLAAQSFPRTSFDAPIDTLDTNILGTTRLLDAVRQFCPQAIVHVCSSSEVFGRVPKEKVPIGEECSFHPASPYAISKAGCDLVGRFYAEAYSMNVQTTRMFTHTGPRRGDVFAESSFAKQVALIEVGLMRPVVKVGNLASLRTIADVRDAVRAYHMLVTVNPIPGEVYNIGGTHTCTVGDILDTLVSMAEYADRISIEVDPDRLRPIDADLQVPDTSKFRAHTGWEPQIPFHQTMRELMGWWREKVARDGARVLQR